MEITLGSDMWRGFTLAEICTSVFDRGRYAHAASFERSVMRHRPDQPRHMSVARFRPGETTFVTADTACFLPWTIIEPETGDLLDNWKALCDTVEVLRSVAGFDLSRAHIRFSGNKSLWLCLPACLMGYPVGSVGDQKALRQRVFLPLMECEVDEHLWDGRHLCRLVGSRHEKGGRTCILPWCVLESPGDLQRHIRSRMHHGYPPIDRHPCPKLYARTKAKRVFHVPLMERVDRDPRGGSLMRETEDGVSEGNRNYIAYCRACGYLRGLSESGAWSELAEWNCRNDPPLDERELRQCFRSAHRTMQRAA